MKTRRFSLCLLLWFSATTAFAQTEGYAPTSQNVATTAPTVASWQRAQPGEATSIFDDWFVYAGLDYLLWWMKPVCLKVPVLTAGSTADAVPGAIGQPNTTVLVGGSRFEFGGASGIRPRVGMLLGPE